MTHLTHSGIRTAGFLAAFLLLFTPFAFSQHFDEDAVWTNSDEKPPTSVPPPANTFAKVLNNTPYGYGEDFEDGTYMDDWTEGNSIVYDWMVTTTDPGEGSFSLRQSGGLKSFYNNGLINTFPASQPTSISYRVKPTTADASHAYVLIGDNTTNNSDIMLFAYYYAESGRWRFVGTMISSVPATLDTWVEFELKNIDWTNKVFDVYMNGNLVISDFPFRGQSITSVNTIELMNFDNGVAFYDDIQIHAAPANAPPVAACQPVMIDANSACQGQADAADFDSGSFDPDGDPITISVQPAGPYPLGTTQVTLTVSDGQESDECMTTITVTDNEAPLFCKVSSAAASAYDDGWQSGDNDGEGFSSWSFFKTSSNPNLAGHFVFSSTNNGDGDDNSDGDIDTDNRAWGLYANSGNQAGAVRNLSAPLTPGSRLAVKVDNGFVDAPPSNLSFQTWSNSGNTNAWYFRFDGGDTEYLILDGNGLQNTGIPVTDEGVEIELNILSSNQLSATITSLDPNTGGTWTYLSPLLNNGFIDQIRIFNNNVGMGSSNDLFINDLRVCYADQLICASSQTVVFNGEESFAASDLIDIDATDNCGPVSVTYSPSQIECEDVGTTVTVLVTIMDQNGNSNYCTADIVVEGLPCDFMLAEMDCSGDANYDPPTETFTLEATNCYYANPFRQDKITFVKAELCGDGEFIAEVSNITPYGWAGIMMRETLDAGSKKIALSRDNGNFARREARTTTNAAAYPQQFMAFGKNWLRLVRQGNTFIGYLSPNGINWQQVMVSNIPMGECIYVGMFLTNKQFSTQTITADFHNVEFNPASNGLSLQELPGVTSTPIADISVYPNPTAGLVTVDLGHLLDKEVKLEVRNTNGQLLQQQDLGRIGNRYTELQLGQLPVGIYWLRVQAEGEAPMVQRIVLQRP